MTNQLADIITYRSKLGGSTIAVTFMVSAILYVAAFSTETPAIGLSILGLFWAVFLYLYFSISYTITRYELTIVATPFYKKSLPISSIRKIREVESPSVAPALSLNRIIILTHKGDHVTISPQNTHGFIRELKYRNPDIYVEIDY